jgi:hypothetical protein
MAERLALELLDAANGQAQRSRKMKRTDGRSQPRVGYSYRSRVKESSVVLMAKNIGGALDLNKVRTSVHYCPHRCG